MTHLVDQREHTVKVVGLVEKHIRMRTCAGGICPSALALVLVNVNPAALKSMTDGIDIVLSEGSDSLKNRLFRLVERYPALGFGNDRRIDIVHMKLVKSHQLLAELHVSVHMTHVLVNGLYEVEIDLLRHLGAEESRLKRGVELLCAGEELQLAHLTVKERGCGVAEAAVGSVKRVKGIPAEDSVAALHIRNVGPVRQLERVALSVLHIGEAEVGIAEVRPGIRRCAGKIRGGGKQLFLGIRQGVRLSGSYPVKHTAVKLKTRLLLIEPLHVPVGN